jgi:hypothetical protein
LPEKVAASFEAMESGRLVELCNAIDNEWLAEKLANTYRDAKFTLKLFELYLASGDSERTFHDK